MATTIESTTSAQARRTVYDVIEGKSNHDWRVVAFKNSMIAVIIANVVTGDRKSTRLNSSHVSESRMPSSA